MVLLIEWWCHLTSWNGTSGVENIAFRRLHLQLHTCIAFQASLQGSARERVCVLSGSISYYIINGPTLHLCVCPNGRVRVCLSVCTCNSMCVHEK